MDPQATSQARPLFRWGRRLLLVCIALVAVYGLFGALVLPLLAKKIGAEKLGEKIGREVIIDDVAINPFTLTATVKGMRALEADRRTPFASFDTLTLDGSIASLWHMAPIVDAMTLEGLHVSLVRDRDNHYNFSDILERLAKETPAVAQDKAGFSFSNIRITGARVDFDDRPKRAQHQVTDITLSVPFISNLPTHLREFVKPAFSAKVNGAPLVLSGETKPFENSLETHLTLNLDALDARKYLEYAPLALPVKIDSTLVDAQLKCVFTQTQNRVPTVHISGRAVLRDVSVSTETERPLATLARLDIDIGMIDPIAQTFAFKSLRARDLGVRKDLWRAPQLEANGVALALAHRQLVVDEIVSRQGTLALKRTRDGSLEMPALATQSNVAVTMPAADGDAATTGTSSSLAPEEKAPWSVLLKKLAVTDYSVSVTDATVTPAINHRATIAQLDAENISSEKGAQAILKTQLAINKGGSLAVSSTLVISPLAVTAQVDARRIDLTALRPYVAQYPDVRLVSAAATAKGTITVRESGNGMRIGYTGNADIDNLASIENKNNEDLLKWEALKLSGIAFDLAPDAPLSLTIASALLDKFYSRLVLNADGKFNVQELMGAPTTTAAAAPTPAQDANTSARGPAPVARQVRIDKVIFSNGRVNFSDRFIKPNYSADVGEVEGGITGLSSDVESRALVDIKARYDRTAPVAVNGTINPLRGDLFLDIRATGKDIDLPALTAYSEKYAGYGITQGKLLLDVKYHIENGKLDAQNNILLTQLTFGARVESPDATKLPVLFAVSLLKNSRGEIELNLPVSGSLDDPQFAIGALVSRVFVNLLTKAVTAPFALLGAAFGGGSGGSGGEQLAYVDFDYGQSGLTAAAQTKLQTLTKALHDRPALKLEIGARVDAVRDLEALKNAALQRKFKAAKRDALAGSGKPAPEGDEVTMAPADVEKYLKIAYERETFPKPRNALGIAKELSAQEMEASMRSHLSIGDDDLRVLAVQRAERVRDFLLNQGKLPADRLLIASAAPGEKSGKDVVEAASRVEFQLK